MSVSFYHSTMNIVLIIGYLVFINAEISPILKAIKSFDSVIFLRSKALNIEAENIFKKSLKPILTFDFNGKHFHFKPLEKEQAILKFAPTFCNYENKSIPYIKYYIRNNNFLIVTFGKTSTKYINIIEKLLYFQKHTKIILISFSNNTNILESFRSKNFTNVLLFNPKNSKTFLTYYLFPKFKISKETGILSFKNNVKNIHGHTLKICAVESSVRGIKIVRNGEIEFGGYLTSIFKTFIEYLNGTLELELLEDMKECMNKIEARQADFVTGINPYSEIHTEHVTFVPYWLYYGILTPAPKKLKRFLYILSPMSWKVWLIYLIFLILIPFSIYICFSNININYDVYMYFEATIKSLLGLTSNFSKLYFRRVHIILIFFGFISYTWYCILLGSYLTTTLYEKKIETLEDFLKSPYKLCFLDLDYRYLLEKIPEIPTKKAISLTSSEMVHYREITMNTSYGYATGSDLWKNFVKPLQKSYNLKKFVWNKHHLINYLIYIVLRENTFLKIEFEHFIYKIMDLGLYDYWTKKSFFEKKLSLQKIQYDVENNIIVLDLNYFTYAFYTLIAGFLLAIFVYLFEILKKNWF